MNWALLTESRNPIMRLMEVMHHINFLYPFVAGVILTIKAWGAGGAGGIAEYGNCGGAGGFATARFRAERGEVLKITIGKGGTCIATQNGIGGAPNGGNGGANHGAGGGGGSSHVVMQLTNRIHISNSVILGAGGGGGGASGKYGSTGGGGGGGTCKGQVGNGGNGAQWASREGSATIGVNGGGGGGGSGCNGAPSLYNKAAPSEGGGGSGGEYTDQPGGHANGAGGFASKPGMDIHGGGGGGGGGAASCMHVEEGSFQVINATSQNCPNPEDVDSLGGIVGSGGNHSGGKGTDGLVVIISPMGKRTFSSDGEYVV